MAMVVQNQLHNSLVEHLEAAAATISTIHSAENGFNANANQKGDGPKIMNTTIENDLIKIIAYEANITKVCIFMVAF